MLLKAAYFARIGVAETAPLTVAGNIRPAIHRGRTVLGIAWPSPGETHNVRAWAELLVLERAVTPGWAYADSRFGTEVQNAGQRIEPLWREILRYRKNVAYRYEVRQVREAAEWLLVHARDL
jgi:hypothetical protein